MMNDCIVAFIFSLAEWKIMEDQLDNGVINMTVATWRDVWTNARRRSIPFRFDPVELKTKQQKKNITPGSSGPLEPGSGSSSVGGANGG